MGPFLLSYHLYLYSYGAIYVTISKLRLFLAPLEQRKAFSKVLTYFLKNIKLLKRVLMYYGIFQIVYSTFRAFFCTIFLVSLSNLITIKILASSRVDPMGFSWKSWRVFITIFTKTFHLELNSCNVFFLLYYS